MSPSIADSWNMRQCQTQAWRRLRHLKSARMNHCVKRVSQRCAYPRLGMSCLAIHFRPFAVMFAIHLWQRFGGHRNFSSDFVAFVALIYRRAVQIAKISPIALFAPVLHGTKRRGEFYLVLGHANRLMFVRPSIETRQTNTKETIMKTKTREIKTSRRVMRHPTLRRAAKPKLLAYSPRRMVETCGCGHYYESTCGLNHSSNDDGYCGNYYQSTCGRNHSSN